MINRIRFRWRVLTAGAIALGFAPTAPAQQNFIPGWAGLKDGTQAPPGLYAAVLGFGYNSNTVVDASGQSFSTSGSLNSYIVGASISIVTKLKLLGANYAFTVLVPAVSNRQDFPKLSLSSNSGWGLTSIYVQPIQLGWSTKRADFIAGYAVYLPSGAWTFGGSNNYGLGMWTQELSAGTTLYLNEKRSVHFAVEAVYDINSQKKDTTYRQSNPLTLQGGLGMNYGDPNKFVSGWFGVAAFGQWTMKATTYNLSLGPLTGPYPQLYGAGPEFVTLQGALTVRYLWEFGAKSSFQGSLWFVQFALPL